MECVNPPDYSGRLVCLWCGPSQGGGPRSSSSNSKTETQTTTCWLQGTPRLGLYGREFSRGSLSEVAASEPESEVGVREGGARRRHTRRTRAVRPKTTRSQHAWRLVCGAGAASVRHFFSFRTVSQTLTTSTHY
ncbi:GSCOCG00001888001-RA-CDS [Cotesia congregata]|nr:GSCOCG00001888001-RA-CDS [Cotesia congregata]